MGDHLWEHGLLMLAGVLLGVWFSEALPWLKRLLRIENVSSLFLIVALSLLLIVYLSPLQRFFRRRGPRETIRRWRLQGERIREQIIYGT